MRKKTSLTLAESTIAAARAGAAIEGKPLSVWIEQATSMNSAVAMCG
jgi:hypothetical protein